MWLGLILLGYVGATAFAVWDMWRQHKTYVCRLDVGNKE